MPRAVEVMSAVVEDWADAVIRGGTVLAAADRRWEEGRRFRQRWHLQYSREAGMMAEWCDWSEKVDDYLEQCVWGMEAEIGEENIKRLEKVIYAAVVVEFWRYKAWIQERDGIRRRGGKAGGMVAVGRSEARAWWRRFGWLNLEVEESRAWWR